MSTAGACCWKPIAWNGPRPWRDSLSGGEAYGKIIRVDLLHKLHDELKYDSLDALTQGIAQDCDDARAFFATLPEQAYGQTHRQTTRDRI